MEEDNDKKENIRDKKQGKEEEERRWRMQEVICYYPSLLTIICLNPKTDNLISIEVKVGEGGTISSIIHCVDGDSSSISSSSLSSLLQTSHSIPLSMVYLK